MTDKTMLMSIHFNNINVGETKNIINSPTFSAPESMKNLVSDLYVLHVKTPVTAVNWTPEVENSNTVKNDIHFACKQVIMIYTYV